MVRERVLWLPLSWSVLKGFWNFKQPWVPCDTDCFSSYGNWILFFFWELLFMYLTWFYQCVSPNPGWPIKHHMSLELMITPETDPWSKQSQSVRFWQLIWTLNERSCPSESGSSKDYVTDVFWINTNATYRKSSSMEESRTKSWRKKKKSWIERVKS